MDHYLEENKCQMTKKHLQRFLGDIGSFGLSRVDLEVSRDIRGEFHKILTNMLTPHLFSGQIEEIFYTTSIKGTVRGMHIQTTPHSMQKIMLVIQGTIRDIVVCVQPESVNFKKYYSVEISAGDSGLFIPSGYAHGFQVTSESAIVLYLTDAKYNKQYDTGFHFSALNEAWPINEKIVSDKDSKLLPIDEFLNL
jgi:dTDP-4-dehydrorhamnose 3,5-epimerase